MEMLETLNLGDSCSFTEMTKKHENDKWDTWLRFVETFRKPGKQGLVGLLEATDDSKDKFVFKLSQYVNHLVEHESVVMNSLNKMSPYCPHFCKFRGSITCEIDPAKRKEGNPFEISCRHPIAGSVLLCEHISSATKLYNYIMTPSVPDMVIMSTIKQVLLGIAMAQKKARFTHYDLHSCNIMMKECKRKTVFVYALDESNQFCVPTHGHFPVIIDFGFSYVGDMDDGPMWPTLAHTDVGFISTEFDPMADAKLFLTSVSSEYEEQRPRSKSAKTLRKIVRNVFGNLDLDWESGWDDCDREGISDQVVELFNGRDRGSILFKKMGHYCIDLLQSMIILPLESQPQTDMIVAFDTFMKEWVKIEREVGTPFYCLCILKGVCDHARYVRAAYLDSETRAEAVLEFRRRVFDSIDKIVSYCQIKDLRIERMLCGLLSSSDMSWKVRFLIESNSS